MHCVFVGRKECLQRHTDRTQHHLFLDASSKHAFCSFCNDYVYDGEFERLSRRARAKCVADRAGECAHPLTLVVCALRLSSLRRA